MSISQWGAGIAKTLYKKLGEGRVKLCTRSWGRGGLNFVQEAGGGEG